MKKTSVVLLGIACSLQALAQNNKVTSAKMHLDDFISHRDTTELSDAKAAIDEASVNEKTKDEPKMYLYRGEVYLTVFTIRLGNLVSKALPSGTPDKKAISKATQDGYTKIDTTTLCIAANSLMKVMQLAPKDYYADEAKQTIPTCIAQLDNKALQEFNNKHYSVALPLYKRLMVMSKIMNIADTATSYKDNVKMAALSADRAGNTAEAVSFYQKTIDLKYDGAYPYRLLAALYMKENDSTKAFEYVEKGRAAYPSDDQLTILETNYFIGRHQNDKAEGNLKLSINKVEAKPTKDSKDSAQLSSLYVNLGQIYDKRANPVNDAPKPADYDNLFASAESNYLKAIDYAPRNTEVLFVTGVLYYNRGVNTQKEADKIPLSQTDKFNKMKDEAKASFLKAQPFFERVYKIKPDNIENVSALKQVYASTDQTDKADALNKK